MRKMFCSTCGCSMVALTASSCLPPTAPLGDVVSIRCSEERNCLIFGYNAIPSISKAIAAKRMIFVFLFMLYRNRYLLEVGFHCEFLGVMNAPDMSQLYCTADI